MNRNLQRLLAFNAASLFRALRSGPTDAARKLVLAFDVIDPFGKNLDFSPVAFEQLKAIPERDISEVVEKIPVVRIPGKHSYIEGSPVHEELMALVALLTDLNPEIVVEIGTFNGSTTAILALNAPHAVIHTVDLPLDFNPGLQETGEIPKDDFHLIGQRKVGSVYKSITEIQNVVQHFADSAKWDFIPVQGASFFFIDGSHTYEYAKNDTEKCLSVGARQSRLVLHDCNAWHPGVVRYLHELVREGWPIVRIKNTSLAFFDREL